MDLDTWRTMLADATFAATHDDPATGIALLAQAEAAYASAPSYYADYADELANARAYVSGSVDRLAVARENATPEDLGVLGTVLTNNTVGDGISYLAGVAFNLGFIDKDDFHSGQDFKGAQSAPKVPVLGGIIRWIREHPVLTGALALSALAAPTVVPMIVKPRRNPGRRSKAKR